MRKLFQSTRIRSFSTSSIKRDVKNSHDKTNVVLPPISPRPPPLPPPSAQEMKSFLSQTSSDSFSCSSSSSLSFSRREGFSDLESASLDSMEAQSQLSLPSVSKRFKILIELVATEKTYTSSLRKMLKYYKEPLKSILSELEIASIFSISELIYDFHCSLLSGLTERVEKWDEEVLIGGFLIQMVSFLRSYSAYVNNYTLAIKVMSQCEEQPQFQEMMESLKNTLADDGMKLQSLYSYLIMPIQRIPRYLLLLDDLRSHTTDDHPDAAHLQTATSIISDIATYIDAKRSAYEQGQRMAALSLSILGVPPDQSVLKPNRTLIWEGPLLFKDRGTKVYLFLFSDAIFVTKLTKNRKSRISFQSRPLSGSFDGTLPRSGSRLSSSSPQQVQNYRFLDSISLTDPTSIVVSNYGDDLFSISVLNDDPTTSRTFLFELLSAAESEFPRASPKDCLPLICDMLKIDIPPVLSREFLPPTILARSLPARRNSIFKNPLSPRSQATCIVKVYHSLDSGLASSRARSSSLSDSSFLSSDQDLENSSFNSSDLSHSTRILAGFIPPSTIPIPSESLSWADLQTSAGDDAIIGQVSSGYQVELGGGAPRTHLFPPFFVFPEQEIPFYRNHMAPREHINLFADLPDKSNPVIVSIEEIDTLPFRRVVIRSPQGDFRTVIPLTIGPFGYEYEPFRAHLRVSFPHIFPPELRWTKHQPSDLPEQLLSPRGNTNPLSLSDRLCQYDQVQQEIFHRMKIGVVPTKSGDILSGNDRSIFQTSTASPDFSEFLNFLGETFPLRGYEGFSGGLDTENDRTGTHAIQSVFKTPHNAYEVLFHVSTLLPHAPNEDQQVAKKRHIGNDVVVVVFHEDETPFDPKVFISKFNQVFIVIKKVGVHIDGSPLYRLAITCKDLTPPWYPLLPEYPVFMADRNFHRFLMAKIINAEATVLSHSPAFSSRIARARADLLSQIIMTYS